MNKRLVKVMRKVLRQTKGERKILKDNGGSFPIEATLDGKPFDHSKLKQIVFVFAGCAKEVQTWQQFNPGKIGMYVSGVNDLIALHNVPVEYCGTWFLRTDSAEIQKEIDRINWENATDD